MKVFIVHQRYIESTAIKLLLNFIVLGLNSRFQQQPISSGKVCFKVQSRSFMWFEEEQPNTNR